LYGGAAAMLFVLGVGAYTTIDRTANYKPAKASVYLIDRKCQIVETTTDPVEEKTKSSRTYSGDCKSVGEWDKVRSKRDKSIVGNAVVHVSYTAPQDGSSRSSELRYDSKDDEFFDLKAGDEIEILVSNSDPNKIVDG
jgi:hypothetical protein